MVSKSENPVIRPVWLVGASFGGTADQTPRFLREGRWENGYFDRYIEDVKSVLPGDRIAIKASYVRWQNLPFDNRGHPVSVMGIKATGTVTENAGDGRNLKVDWTPVDPPREWFFYTYRGTVWRVLPGRWATDGLISFVFEGEEQDIDAFRNDDYWKDRLGDQQESDPRFAWTDFYSEFADIEFAVGNDNNAVHIDIRRGIGYLQCVFATAFTYLEPVALAFEHWKSRQESYLGFVVAYLVHPLYVPWFIVFPRTEGFGVPKKSLRENMVQIRFGVRTSFFAATSDVWSAQVTISLAEQTVQCSSLWSIQSGLPRSN